MSTDKLNTNQENILKLGKLYYLKNIYSSPFSLSKQKKNREKNLYHAFCLKTKEFVIAYDKRCDFL